MLGAMSTLETVWSLGDLTTALLTFCNLIGITGLAKYAFRLLEDYREQKKRGVKDPVFHRSQLPEIEQEIECWE
jgi:AGCS family alanine or glycine:cation symporter